MCQAGQGQSGLGEQDANLLKSRAWETGSDTLNTVGRLVIGCARDVAFRQDVTETDLKQVVKLQH